MLIMVEMLEDTIRPDNTALLVIDKQIAYLDPVGLARRGKGLPEGHEAVLAGIDNFVDEARVAGVPVIWTRMAEDSEYSPYPISTLIADDSNMTKRITVPGDPSYEFFGRTRPEGEEAVFDKVHYDAFAHTRLSELLTKLQRKSVILVGGYATRCVLATAIGANNDARFVVVPRDLVINQTQAEHELPTLFGVVGSILGRTTTSEKIIHFWHQP